MKKFKEFLNEADKEIEFSVQTTHMYYLKNAKDVILDDLNLSKSGDLEEGKFIIVYQFGVKSNPGKNLTKEMIKQIKKVAKGSEYKIVHAQWISPKGQDWNGKIWQSGGALEVIIELQK
jgi:hypothetical protein